MANDFTIDDYIFDDIKGKFSATELQTQIDLINASPLMKDLLTRFKLSENNLFPSTDKKNYYNGDIYIGDFSDNNFVRLLSHELGHFQYEVVDGEKERGSGIGYVLDRETNESVATATSYIIRRQIRRAA